MKTLNSKLFDTLKKDFLMCLKLTLIFGVVFTLINQQFTIKGIGMIFLISAMYSFTLGLGNGIVNYYLDNKWDWVEQTNQRVWAGVLGTIIYTIIAVLGIHYIQYIILYNNDSSVFF